MAYFAKIAQLSLSVQRQKVQKSDRRRLPRARSPSLMWLMRMPHGVFNFSHGKETCFLGQFAPRPKWSSNMPRPNLCDKRDNGWAVTALVVHLPIWIPGTSYFDCQPKMYVYPQGATNVKVGLLEDESILSLLSRQTPGGDANRRGDEQTERRRGRSRRRVPLRALGLIDLHALFGLSLPPSFNK